jgi:parvulin-like peptidyl-prolyl isomerase
VPAQGRIIQRVLVKVNGEVFTQTQLEHRQVLALKSKKPTLNSLQDLQNDATLRALLETVTPDILVDSVDDLLLVQYGKELGFHMSDEKFKGIVDQFKKENKLGDAELKAALAEEGLSMDSWREMIEHDSIINDVQREEIMQRAQQVTEEERRQYYAKHPEEFKTPASVTLREILIMPATQMVNGKPAVSAAAEENAKARSAAVRDRIVKGEDFVKVAGEVSESATKANGGLLGDFSLDEMDPALRQVIDKMKVGDVTEPLRSQRGYQLFKLEGTAPASIKPFEKVREDIAQKLYDERLEVEQRKFLGKIRTLALIEWKDENLKKVYEKRLAERQATNK